MRGGSDALLEAGGGGEREGQGRGREGGGAGPRRGALGQQAAEAAACVEKGLIRVETQGLGKGEGKVQLRELFCYV